MYAFVVSVENINIPKRTPTGNHVENTDPLPARQLYMFFTTLQPHCETSHKPPKKVRSFGLPEAKAKNRQKSKTAPRAPANPTPGALSSSFMRLCSSLSSSNFWRISSQVSLFCCGQKHVMFKPCFSPRVQRCYEMFDGFNGIGIPTKHKNYQHVFNFCVFTLETLRVTIRPFEDPWDSFSSFGKSPPPPPATPPPPASVPLGFDPACS